MAIIDSASQPTTPPDTFTTRGGSTLTADQIKGWTDLSNPDPAQFAANAAMHGMSADDIAQAVHMGGWSNTFSPADMNRWVSDTAQSNRYTWAPDGTLTHQSLSAPAAPAAQPAAQLGSPTPWKVTPEQTVQGRIDSIINPQNPLMVQAETQANQQSNARGLINSSMAVTGGQDAMYRAATPIAAADAATFAKAAGYNADEGNQFAVHNVDAKNQLGIAQLQSNTQTAIAGMNSDTQQKIATLDANTRTTLQTQQDQNQVLLNTSSQAAQAFNQYVVAAANIQNNPNLDAANKTAALQTLWTSTHSQLAVLGKLNGLDLTSLLDMTGVPGSGTAAPVPAPGIVNSAVENGT